MTDMFSINFLNGFSKIKYNSYSYSSSTLTLRYLYCNVPKLHSPPPGMALFHHIIALSVICEMCCIQDRHLF